MAALLLKTFKYQQKETFMTLSSIILTIICFGFTLLHYLSLRQDRQTVEDIKRLEARITTLEKGNQP
jgi:hypothetical protein